MLSAIGIIPPLVGGLVLFLFSIFSLSRLLQKVFTERVRTIVGKGTSNIFMALIIGSLMTLFLGSSSAVIIIAILFINAGSLTFRQATGIIMGANIGTTFTSQLIVLDIGQLAIWIMALALLLDFFVDEERKESLIRILFFFGMLFFGLQLMESAVLPLKEEDLFLEWFYKAGANPLMGAAAGGIATLIIQSSSATVGMAIILGKQNLLSLAGGIAIMMGAELGTCADTLLATIRGSRQAVKAGLFHLVFNLLSIILGLALFYPFVNFVELVSNSADIAQKIANAHVLFNLLGVALFLPLSGVLVYMLDRLIPERPDANRVLNQAYHASFYATIEEPYLSIRTGAKHPKLDQYMDSYKYKSWIFISAENPQSRELSYTANRLNTRAMLNYLEEHGYHFIQGLGIPSSGDWQAESSFLVFNITNEKAEELARLFDQKAIVKGSINEKAILHYIPPSK